MAGGKIVDPGWGWDKALGYSQGVRVGNLVYYSGQMPVDSNGKLVHEGDIKGQTHQVFKNIKAALAAAGLTLNDIVEMVSFHTNMADLGAMAEVKNEYIFKGDFPAWTVVGVTSLALPGQMLEI